MPAIWDRGISILAYGLRAIYRVRGPLLVSLACGAVLALVPQAREIYRILILDARQEAGVIAVTAASLTVLIAVIWALCWTAPIDDEPRTVRRATAILCAVLPPLGIAVGLWRAGLEVTPLGLGQPVDVIDSSIVDALSKMNALQGTLSALAVGTGIYGIVIAVLVDVIASRFIPCRLGLRWIAVPIFLSGIALGIWFAVDPTDAPRWIGSIGLFLLFILILAAVVTSLLQVHDRWGIPALLLLILMAAGFSWSNFSDNHIPQFVERARDETSGEPRAVVPTVLALQSWLEGRADKAYFEERNQPYPIFIISAEGGGQYAAYLTATFLARAQDRCPNFAQHIFAISSVSGGAIGAGIFSALSKTFAQNTTWQGCKFGDLGVGPFEAKANAILERDFLSPVVAAALFGDLPHAFFPVLKPTSDRARAFEQALESAWDQTLPGADNPLKRSYFALWDAKGAAPAVLANATQVENGMRVVVAPFMSIDSPMESGTLHQRSRRTVYIGMNLLDEGWEALKPTEDVRLSTAIGLSARFPWVMPAARFQTSNTEFRLVDGAYIDNSGDETAFDLIMELGQLDAVGGKLTDGSEVPRYQFHLITLTDDVELAPGAVQGFGDLLSPIRTMLATRPTRSEMAKHRVRAFINRSPEITVGTKGDFSSPAPWVRLNQQEFHIPLTWQLSETSRKLIAAQAGEAQRCGFRSVFEIIEPEPTTSYQQSKAFEHINEMIRDNNCVACSIPYRLRGEQPKSEQACQAR